MTLSHFTKRCALLLAFAAAPLLPGSLWAQTHPSKPIRLVASYPHAGGTDMMARIIAKKLQAQLGQPVVVENRAGGMGIIGAKFAATSKPDGYTLYLGSSDHMAAADPIRVSALRPRGRFHPRRADRQSVLSTGGASVRARQFREGTCRASQGQTR